jgi:hypothetical protein
MKNVIILLFCSVLILAGCPKRGEYVGVVSSKNKGVSPKGAQIFSPNSISSQGLPIDAGLDETFRIAASSPNNYSGIPTHSSYSVYLWPRDRRCEAAAIYRQFQSNNQYDGTEYDKDPRPGKVALCFAGMLLGLPGYPSAILVVDDAGAMKNATAYEAEHAVLYHSDRPRFHRTIGADHVHPLLTADKSIGPSFAVFIEEASDDLTLTNEDGSPAVEIRKGDLIEGLVTR